MKTKTISILVMLCACISVFAQNEIDTKLVLAQDDMRMQDYRAATRSLHWLMTNAPQQSKSIYIMAYKGYEKAAEKSTDKAEKAMLLDSMMLSYRLKEVQFGLTDLEKNNYAFRFYKYFRKDASKLPEALEAYKGIYKSPETVINNNLVTYMSLIRSYQAKTKGYDVKELMSIRGQMANVINMKISEGGDLKRLKKYSDTIEKLFFETVKPVLNCNAIEELAKDAADHDIEYTKMIFSWSYEFGCTDTDFFVEAATTIANDPDAGTPGIMKILAQIAAAERDYEKAIYWYEKSLPMWENDMKRAQVYMSMAKVHLLDKKKSKARTAAFNATEFEPAEAAAAYSFVANLYMASFEECAEGYSQVDDRAIFMAAYDLFQKAGDTAGMQSAQAQFPTTSQAFSETYEEGARIDVSCWINVKTKLRTRKSN